MTVSTTASKVQYTCDGSTDTFPYTFRVLDSSDLYVVWTDSNEEDHTWTENTEYTVTGIGEEFGGNVVVETLYVPASGTTLTLYREIPYTQESDYVENDPFHADTLETDLDRTIMIIQQLAENLSRALYLNITDGSTPDLTIPNLGDRASTYLGFDASGDLTVYDDISELIGTGTDNHVARYDGTDDIQTSLVIIDDAGNISGIKNLTMTGDLVVGGDVTVTGDIVGYATDAELTTVSGDLVSYINSEISSVSGSLVSYIDNSINTVTTITISGTPGADHTAEGMKIDAYTAGENLVYGNFVYRKSDGKFWKADKGASTTMPIMAMATESITASATGEFLLNGIARDDSWTWSPGAILYGGASGALTATPPSTTGEQLQVVGIALTATVIRFDPDYTLVEIA